jgi:hypothetical protein
MLIANGEFEQPFGTRGEWFTPPSVAPPAPVSRSLEIEPWPEHERRQAMQASVDPEPPGTMGANALAELKARQGEDAYDPPPAAGPLARVEPLRPVKIPEWSDAQRRAEQLARERAEQGIHEEHPQRHPAPPRREPAA